MKKKPERPVLWTAAEVAAVTGGRWATPPAPGLTFTDVAYNSNEISPDCLLVTRNPRNWPGRRIDGTKRAADYARRGAAAIIVDRVPEGWRDQAPLLVVPDTRAALTALGDAGRARFRGRVVAITGTVGKTSTKEFLRQGLAAAGSAVVTSRNMHSHGPGISLTLALLPPDADVAVIEVGMSRDKGSIRERVAHVRPHIAVVTDIGYDHMRERTSLTEVALEKAEIFTALEAGGTAIVNRDAPAFRLLKEAIERHGIERFVTVGWGGDAEARLLTLDYDDGHGSLVTASLFGEPVSYRLNWVGRPPAFCALIALAVAREAGADWRAMIPALADIDIPFQRMERFEIAIPGGTVVVFDDNYNASPKSVEACFETAAALPLPPGGRRIAVLTDMGELGGMAPALHADLAEPFKRAGFDLLFSWGEHILRLREALGESVPPGGHFETVKAMALAVQGTVRPGDMVFLKGSDPRPEITALDQVVHALQVYGFTGRRAMV